MNLPYLRRSPLGKFVIRLLLIGLSAIMGSGMSMATSALFAQGAESPFLQPVWLTDEYDHSQSVAWGDVDGDGDLDLAVGNAKGEPNRIYRNEDGRLALAVAWNSGDGDETTSIAFADFNGDGVLDIAAGNAGQANKIYLLTIDNEGAIRTAGLWQSDDHAVTTSIAIGDLNGDAIPDLVAGNATDGVNRIYLFQRQHCHSAFPDSPPCAVGAPRWMNNDGDGSALLRSVWLLSSDPYFQVRYLDLSRKSVVALPATPTRGIATENFRIDS